MRLEDSSPKKEPSYSISSTPGKLKDELSWLYTTQPITTPPRKSTTSQASTSHIQCPWWSTQGHCRDEAKGICGWAHEDLPGTLKEPLICSFWADGQGCNKSDEDCRFAHYWA
ncbi:hypothetical protein BX600DRAFT_274549 [Xylariales sp. PMI_506]|nr:hypothetical protein BX600DRAFT_274549 [Xylariales sp. PMI_506]